MTDLRDVLAAFGLSECAKVMPAGGTASPKWDVATARGRFVVRVRPPEFAAAELIRFHHEVVRRLAGAGLPVPTPLSRPDGTTWLCHGGQVYEVLHWIDGDPWDERAHGSDRAVGRFLADFHRALADTAPTDRLKRLREDHPDLMAPYLAGLRALAPDAGRRDRLDEVERQLEIVRIRLDSGLYASLPHSVIHGDFHPGNVRFRGPRVAAVYDFDYLDVQARARDLSDGLMFFASRRDGPLLPEKIRSLTRPMRPDADRCRRLIGGYQDVSRLTDPEWEALPLLMRSRWLQMRLRGARKVPEGEKVDFVLEDFFSVIKWLEREGTAFFGQLKQST